MPTSEYTKIVSLDVSDSSVSGICPFCHSIIVLQRCGSSLLFYTANGCQHYANARMRCRHSVELDFLPSR